MLKRSELERFRDRRREAIFPGKNFYIIPRNGVMLEIITSVQFGWEHLSMVIITPDLDTRIPTYEEMVFAKGLFWEENEICIEVHPKKSEYVNINPDCLHIWKRIGENYKESSNMITDFIKTFPQNTSSTMQVTQLRMYDKLYCIVTGPNRWPTWNELCEIKSQYFEAEEAAVQYHFSKSTDLNANFIIVITSAPTHLPCVFQI